MRDSEASFTGQGLGLGATCLRLRALGLGLGFEFKVYGERLGVWHLGLSPKLINPKPVGRFSFVLGYAANSSEVVVVVAVVIVVAMVIFAVAVGVVVMESWSSSSSSSVRLQASNITMHKTHPCHWGQHEP